MVQRGRTVPTLSSVARASSPAGSSSGAEFDKLQKERQNQDTKSEERGETEAGPDGNVFQQIKNIPSAGRPSEAPRRTSISGRRSRRTSVDDNASQLSVENLGGSQENLSLLGRNPDKEMRTHSGRRGLGGPVEAVAYTVQPDGSRGESESRYIDNRDLEEMEKHQREGSPYGGKQGFDRASESPDNKVSFADFRRQKARDQFHTSAINITYTEQENEKEDLPKRSSGFLQRRDSQKDGASPSAASNNLFASKPQQQQATAPIDAPSAGIYLLTLK